MENDKLVSTSRRTVVTLLIRNHVMMTFPIILSGKDKYNKALKELTWIRFACYIFVSYVTYNMAFISWISTWNKTSGSKAVEKIARARNEAKKICTTSDSYSKWLDKNFQQYPNDKAFFQPELLENLEQESRNEEISLLANDLSTSSIEDELYMNLWGQS